MKKFIFIQILVWLFCINATAQSIVDLKNNADYYWGEYTAENKELANKEALNDLVSKISLQVVTERTTKITNEQSRENAKTTSEFISKTKAYSKAKLSNVNTMEQKMGSMFYIFKYVHKSEVERIFTERKEKVEEFVQIGHQALIQKQIGDAFRYYYWAHILNNSLPHPEETEITDQNGSTKTFTVWFPLRMNEIFSNLSMEVLSRNNNEYVMGFFYQKEPVANIEFTYFDGQSWSCITQATDGKGVLEMRPTFTPDRFQVQFEYQFLHEVKCDNEIEEIIRITSDDLSKFGKAYKTLSVTKIIDQASAEAVNLKKVETNVANFETNSNETTVADCNRIMQKVISAIRAKNYVSINNYFTDEGYKIFTQLINYGNARIIGEPHLSYTTVLDETYCRSIPMNFTFSAGKRKFVEDVVFIFNKDGLIDNVSFSLGKIGTNDIIEKSYGMSVDAKNVLINFLEVYKTAFALERKDYIRSIFADDALIITGKVVTKSTRKMDGTYETNKHVVRNKQSKEEYISNLEKLFDRSYVNIKFANTQVLKMGKGGEIYSIQVRQDFYSSSYSDSGYLFILVDLNNPKEPTIRVRTWQEHPDPDFGKFGPEIF